MGKIPNFMPNPKQPSSRRLFCFIPFNVPDCPVDFPTLRARAHISAADAAMDFPALRARVSFGVFCGFSSYMQSFLFFFRGFLHICGAFRRSVAFFKMEKANIEIES